MGEISIGSESKTHASIEISKQSSDCWKTAVKITALKVASLLNAPICKVREYFYSFYILDETCKTTAQKVVKVMFLSLGIILFAVLTPVTAPFAALIRCLVVALESKPYIFLEKDQKGKILPANKEITMVTHNQGYMPAGYSITDGQLTPPSDKERINANIQKIKELNPDIVCLYEVPDIFDACYLSSQLPEYPFVIPVAGVRAIGPSSMMYVASKYEIVKSSIEFVPFIKNTELTGRACYSEKGYLSFDIKSADEEMPCATVISTHLQHSEIPFEPLASDITARALQMKKIANRIKEKIDQGKAVIFTGDLNEDETELEAFLEVNRIDWLRRDPAIRGRKTWGGDKWCSELMGKTSSGPLVLDYTFVAGKVANITTDLVGTGFSNLEFRPKATSDHDLLFSTITLA